MKGPVRCKEPSLIISLFYQKTSTDVISHGSFVEQKIKLVDSTYEQTSHVLNLTVSMLLVHFIVLSKIETALCNTVLSLFLYFPGVLSHKYISVCVFVVIFLPSCIILPLSVILLHIFHCSFIHI